MENKKSLNYILKLLSEPDTLKILRCTENIPMSVQQIIKNTNLPYSTVYKKIKWMAKNELLFLHKMEITKSGKKFSLFKSKISSIIVTYEKGRLNVNIQKI